MDRKVAVGGTIGLPLGVLLVYLVETSTGTKLPVEVAAAVGAICVWASNWFVPNKE